MRLGSYLTAASSACEAAIAPGRSGSRMPDDMMSAMQTGRFAAAVAAAMRAASSKRRRSDSSARRRLSALRSTSSSNPNEYN